MSDHLPECFLPSDFRTVAVCICTRIRACEARMEDEWLNRYNAAEQRGYDAGFRNGLDAAREAVAALLDEFPNPDFQIANAAVHTALAAIDALRGSGNPDTPPSAERGEKP